MGNCEMQHQTTNNLGQQKYLQSEKKNNEKVQEISRYGMKIKTFEDKTYRSNETRQFLFGFVGLFCLSFLLRMNIKAIVDW